MMIGPDAYYEVNLKGRDKDYILSAIREMQDKIARLKELMENPENKHKDIVHPSEDVQIKCTRDYIARAIQAYEELGGIYHPSELEKADMEFQRNIGNISKITFEIGGFFEGRTEYVIEFAGDDALLTQSQLLRGQFLTGRRLHRHMDNGRIRHRENYPNKRTTHKHTQPNGKKQCNFSDNRK